MMATLMMATLMMATLMMATLMMATLEWNGMEKTPPCGLDSKTKA
jgi:hypothetical protein